ncbi:hypothetical protein U9M48_005399 [Paspalum notatum var. saurae]|uniref:Uncharacterized protein n=1 Tax=Paspalum notatum var. saurae TaxID=547442 RepID=A0AAQ3SJW8_PASNO
MQAVLVPCPAGDSSSRVIRAAAAAAESPYEVAVAWNDRGSTCVCVYSSETGEWGVDVASAPVKSAGFNASICNFDLGSHELAVVGVPRDVYYDHHGLYLSSSIPAKGGGGGLTLVAMEPYLRARVWVRAPGAVTGWTPRGTLDVGELLSLRPGAYPFQQPVLGLAGDDNVLFVSTYRGAFMVHLDSMEVEKIRFRCRRGQAIHPFSTPLSAAGTRFKFKNCSFGF